MGPVTKEGCRREEDNVLLAWEALTASHQLRKASLGKRAEMEVLLPL